MKREGFVLIAVLSMAVLVVMLLVVASTFAVSARQSVVAETQKIPAFYAANAGLERAVARMNAYLASSGTTYLNSRPEVVADQVANVLHLSDLQSGPELPGGAFTVRGAASGSAVELVSVGTAPSGATRSLSLKYDVYYILKTLSNAAVNATGRIALGGARLVEGDPVAPPDPSSFTIACRAPCRPTGSRPVTYTVNLRGGALPDVGDVVTLASSPTSGAAFKVRQVDRVGGTLDLAALDATRTALSDGLALTRTRRGAALLTTDAGGLPVSPDCQTYACGELDVPGAGLFQETFGIGKQTFSGEVGAHYGADACGGVVRWIDLPGVPAPTLTLSDCPAARIVIVRAPPASDTPGGPPVPITVGVTPGSVFRGLLYVIGTHDLEAGRDATIPPGSGSNVTLSATDGAFTGSVIVENAVTDALNAARTTTLSATTTRPPAGGGCPIPFGTADAYAFCYDRSVLGGLLGGLNASLPDSAKPRVAVARYSWTENGN